MELKKWVRKKWEECKRIETGIGGGGVWTLKENEWNRVSKFPPPLCLPFCVDDAQAIAQLSSFIPIKSKFLFS